MSNGVELRAYCFLDSLQPQYAAFLGTVAQGFLPLPGDASLYVEISPGIEINRLTDVALKATNVRPGMQVIERYFGLLEVHSPEQAETRAAGAAILESIGLTESDRIKPRILSSQIVRRIDDHHAQLINRTRHGQMIIGGQTLYVLECEPAAYAAARGERGGEGRRDQRPRGPLRSARWAGCTSAARSATSTSAGRPRWRRSKAWTAGRPAGRDGSRPNESRIERRGAVDG